VGPRLPGLCWPSGYHNLAPQRAHEPGRARAFPVVDRLVNQAGERDDHALAPGSRIAAAAQFAGRPDGQPGTACARSLRDIELQAESQMQSRLGPAKDSAAGSTPLEFDHLPGAGTHAHDGRVGERRGHRATQPQRTVESTEDDLIAQARQTRELQPTCCARAWWSSKEFPSASTE